VDELPVGTVTFLFTDIEGSTQLLKRWRQRYAEALAEHQRILREVFAEHDGHEIDTQGDSFFVAFRRAKDAVAAAVDCQRRLAAEPWPDGGQLRVRMGIHTGEPAAAGQRYVGLGVHRAARICAAGHGGQVLVSQTTRELLRDDPLPEVSLRDLGEHQLKDMDEPERLYQLAAPGLDEDFPPLKAAAPSPFAGREGELAEAAAQTMARRWRRPGRRTLLAATFAAALVGLVVGVALTQGGGSTAGAAIAANSVGVIDSANGKLLSTVPVGSSPGGVAAGEGGVWVTNSDDNTVSLIDPRTNQLRQTIAVGGGPAGVAAGGGAVWVTNGLDGTVSRIDPTVDRVVGSPIHVGNGPVGVAYGEGAVWVANSVDGTVARIDPSTWRVTRTTPAVPGVTGVVAAFGRVWVVSPSAGVVLGIDARSGNLVDRVPVSDPDAIAAGEGAIWVASGADGTVTRIDPTPPAHVSGTAATGGAPNALAVVNRGVWVADRAAATVTRIDAASAALGSPLHLLNPPEDLAASPDGIYVAVRSNGAEHRGGTLHVSGQSPDTLDPAQAYTLAAWSVLSMTNDGLVAFRRVSGVEGAQIVPDLAVDVPLPTDDGKTYTFRIREGVRYSTGAPVRPVDFRTALERVFEARSPPSPARQYFGDLVGADRCRPGHRCNLAGGVEVDNAARTVTFHLRTADADFPAELALPWAAAVPTPTSGRAVGTHVLPATGPYMVAAYRPNRSIRLVRNPEFRQWSSDAQPVGYPDTLVWTFWDNPGSAVRAVQRGAADVAASLTLPPLSKRALADLAARYPSQVHFTPTSTTNYFFLNTRVPPFDDIDARRAVNYAFDQRALARQLGLGFAPTCQILPPNYPGYRRTCLYGSGGAAGVNRARRLVRRSGTAGMRVTVWTPTGQAGDGRYAMSVLRAIGYRAGLKTVKPGPAPKGYFARIYDPSTRAQMGYTGWLADFPSDAGYLPPQFSCAVFSPDPHLNQDASEFCDRRVDRLLREAAAAQAQNPGAAPALWNEAERAILEQAPLVPTYNQQDVTFLGKNVGNFQYHTQWGVLLDQLWVR
jgi:peptide/nickel transport system substrate-binding protein